MGALVRGGDGRLATCAESSTPEQVALLRGCAGAPVDLGTLTVLPPVAAIRGRAVDAALPELEVRAERWTVGDLDPLEPSAVADIDQTRTKQAALTRYVRSRGLAADQDQDNETGQLVEYLARTTHGSR